MQAANPVLVEVTRGGVVESRHRGSFAVADAQGRLAASAGDVGTPVYPRSAVKAFQALPVIAEGAADRFGFSAAEIALACASHGGEAEHVATAQAMLSKIGLDESAYECGAHWPYDTQAMHALIARGAMPSAFHNNCSGKHAAMLALALHMGVRPQGYTGREHPVQRRIAETLRQLCDIDPDAVPCGIDGCSVPTWAIPLRDLAKGFARFGCGTGLSPEQSAAARRILDAVAAHPFLVAGRGRFCTRLMQALPRAFVKTGAEGVFCGAIPHLGLGIALKCEDGATRAAECAMATLLAAITGWTPAEAEALRALASIPLENRRHLRVGQIRPLAGAFPSVAN
jgi:L-asparaginase II